MKPRSVQETRALIGELFGDQPLALKQLDKFSGFTTPEDEANEKRMAPLAAQITTSPIPQQWPVILGTKRQ